MFLDTQLVLPFERLIEPGLTSPYHLKGRSL